MLFLFNISNSTVNFSSTRDLQIIKNYKLLNGSRRISDDTNNDDPLYGSNDVDIDDVDEDNNNSTTDTSNHRFEDHCQGHLSSNSTQMKYRRSHEISTFCRYIRASLNQMNDKQIDEIIENITILLFRKRKESRSIADNW